MKSEYFVKLQRAMEAITSGTADGKVNENALMERVKGTIQRCAELSPVIGMWLALSLWGAFMQFLQSRGKRKSKRKGGKKKKRKSKKNDVVDDKDGKESTQPKSDEDATKEDEKIAPPSPSSDDDDDDDDEDGDSSSGEEDDGDDEDDEDDDALPHVGPSFVGASVLSNIYGGQRRRPSAKGRASAGLRTSEPRTVGGRRIQTPIVMPTRTDTTTTTNPENNSSSDKKEN
jgi:hypothetical protein